MADVNTYQGGCHCGRVRFQAELDLSQIIACNCSICSKHGLWLAFTPAAKFTLLSGEGDLVDYQFGKKTIHHRHCGTCGVETFGTGTAPDGTQTVAVNVRCLDDVDLTTLTPAPFDGKSL
jgi:hypothetical protein